MSALVKVSRGKLQFKPVAFAPFALSVATTLRLTKQLHSSSVALPEEEERPPLLAEDSTPSRPSRFIHDGRSTHKISTLDPKKLSPRDCVDLEEFPPALALRYEPAPGDSDDYWAPFKSSSRVFPEDLTYRRSIFLSKFFPRSIRGFFYYHFNPRAPPLAGALRFRITPSTDPASFAAGHDLYGSQFVPFSVPIFAIASSPTYSLLRIIIANDGLVSADTLRLAKEYASRVTIGDVRISRPVHAFGQPFSMDLSLQNHMFVFVGDQSVNHLIFTALTATRDWVPGPKGKRTNIQYSPFKGTVECCFERYPIAEHPGKRFVAIRILRESPTDPIRCTPLSEYEGPAFPKELVPRVGELLHLAHFNGVKPWVANVDGVKTPLARRTKRASSLAVLFENESKYGRYEGDELWPSVDAPN